MNPHLHSTFAFLLAVVAHEAGHILTAKFRGVQVKRVGVSYRGPYLIRERGSRSDSIAISLAGPLANLLLFVVFALLGDGMCSAMNLVLGLSNLIPAFGLDGQRLYRELKQEGQ